MSVKRLLDYICWKDVGGRAWVYLDQSVICHSKETTLILIQILKETGFNCTACCYQPTNPSPLAMPTNYSKVRHI